jgi:Domain of unknown function (DUF4743)
VGQIVSVNQSRDIMMRFALALTFLRMLYFCNISNSLKINLLTASTRIHRRCSSKVYGSHLSTDTMATLKKRVDEINYMSGVDDITKTFVPLRIKGLTYGYVSLTFAKHLSNYPETFKVDDNTLTLTPEVELMSLTDRSEVVGKVTEDLKKQKIITGMILDARFLISGPDSLN